MKETKIQHTYVMPFLCKSEEEGGLGYREVSHNIVSSDLFIPSVLAEFVKNNVTEKVWNGFIRKFGDEETLEKALKDAVKERMMDFQNVAIFLNQNKTMSFEGEKIPLFFVSGTELKGDEEFEKNIFCAVEESSHTIKYNGEKVYTVRPDVTFFVNGIFIGYMELKTIQQGQSAAVHGRNKVVSDYLSTVHRMAQMEKVGSKVMDNRKELLAIYEKAIHLTASDCNETYVMRGISQFFDMVKPEFQKEPPVSIDAFKEEMLKVFKDYPLSDYNLSESDRFHEVMTALYSKKMIEKEIRYYNFIEYKYVQVERVVKGKKVQVKERKTNRGYLISPRPKQKFGCDKIMGRIVEMLGHEKEPNYYNNLLREELKVLGVPPERIEEVLLKREEYCNNKYVYSLLMQYAAGFGKSNIIGWTALQLKDFRYDDEYAYDKILIVVDRVQLRGQLDTMMYNMNISNDMFTEAKDQDTFMDALEDKKRIIVVNIQKFLDLQNALTKAQKKLKEMRVAFLIDEIHRSNSGENNEEMLNIFADLQKTFNAGGTVVTKKNLLIGFTATPDDVTLTRFGEFKNSAEVFPLWVPFDSYTMQNAIDDEYILDPTKHIIPYVVPIGFALPEGIDPDEVDELVIRQSKPLVYAFEPRMMKIASFVVERLVSLVYGKIHGEGKAMLAVTSIPNAIKYFNIIKKMYAEKCEDARYEKYKDAPICIVYSDSQGTQACSTLNDGLSEEKVIEKFKNGKNGLMIVVDKLQTGFDEPKLHTLFLDKEITGINAIQTISRVNRKAKGKKECHVVDCSWKNVNIQNIKAAFKKYCNIVISEFNPEAEKREVIRDYKDMVKSEPYSQWYSRYQHEKDDAEFAIEMEGGIAEWVRQCCKKEEAIIKQNEENEVEEGEPGYIEPINVARDLCAISSHYENGIRSLNNVLDIDDKFYDETFRTFWYQYRNIYRQVTKKPTGVSYSYVVTDSDDEPFIVPTGEEETGNGGGNGGGRRGGRRGGHTRPPKPKEKSMEEILKILKKLNNQEAISAQQAQIWLKEIGLMFQYMKKDEEFCSYIKDDNFSDEDKFAQYKKLQAKYRRSIIRERPDFELIEEFKQMLNDNMDYLYGIFLADINNTSNQESDFDYDTTTDGGSAPVSIEELEKLIKQKIKPDYDEERLKEVLIEKYESHFKGIQMRGFEEVVDNFFYILNTESLSSLDGIDDLLKESINMLCIAEGMSLSDRRRHFNTLVSQFEAYLKKLYYLCFNKEVSPRKEGKTPTLSDAIFGIQSLRSLRYDKRPEYQEFSNRLTLLRQLRNDGAHQSQVANEQEVNAAIDIVIDVYLFAVGTNITDLEMGEGMRNSVKLVTLEQDMPLCKFVKTRMELPSGATILGIVRDCIENFGENYPSMKINDWYSIVRKFVEKKTQRYDIKDDETFTWIAAEPDPEEI